MIEFKGLGQDPVDSKIGVVTARYRIGMACHQDDSRGLFDPNVVANRFKDLNSAYRGQYQVDQEEVGGQFS